MARNSSLYLRRAGLSLLRSDSALAAFVGTRIYPPQRPPKPTWPFVGWGLPIVGGFQASGMDGNETDFAVHAYAATIGTGGETVSGEERATAIAARVETVLASAGEVDLTDYGCPFPAIAHFEWLQTQVIQDGAEADAYHAIVSFRANVVS